MLLFLVYRAWESLSTVTCCRSLVIVYSCQCIVQIGVAAKLQNNGEPFTVDATKLMEGSLCQGVLKSGARKLLMFGLLIIFYVVTIQVICVESSFDKIPVTQFNSLQRAT